MRNKQSFKNTVLACIGICCAMATAAAEADPVKPGYDFFSSNDRNGKSLGAAVDLTQFGLGTVDLMGEPFRFGPYGRADKIDTVVRRKQGIDPFAPPNGAGIVDIELVALHIVSINPIDPTPIEITQRRPVHDDHFCRIH